jgi:hypothetical protein
MSEHTPDNFILHGHDGHLYAYALDKDGLVRARMIDDGRIMSSDRATFGVDDFDWHPRRVEKIEPQIGPIVDEYDGTVCPVDPEREDYIAALVTALSQTERSLT